MRADVITIVEQLQGLLQELTIALKAEAGTAASTGASTAASTATDPGAGTIAPVAIASAPAMAGAIDGRSERVYYAPPLTYRVRDGVTLAIDGDRPHWLTTNAAGAAILRGCTGENTAGELAARLAQRFGVPYPAALTDTLSFLEALEGIAFVQQSPRAHPPYRGRTETISLGRLADVYLFVTNDCNLRCTHCYVSSGDYVPPREMTTDEILGLVDQARELGAARFLITGGEPFMVRDIYEIIRAVTAESDLVILTNGMYFTERNIARLKDSIGRGRMSLQISLDGPTAELHDAIRGKGTFAKTIPAVERIIAHGFEVAISTAVSRHTAQYMTEMTRLVGRLGAKAHHILWMQEWGRAIDRKPELIIPQAEVLEIMRACRVVGDEIGVTIDNDASLRVRVKGKHGRKTDLCSCGWDTLAVFSDGQVYPCVWLAGAPGMECGSILTQPLERIWRDSPVLEQIRAVSVQNREVCNDCHLKFLCAGGSPCSSHFASLATRGRSDVHSAEPYCETFMGLTHDMLWELGMAGVTANGSGGYEAPRLYNAMDGAGAHCARPNTIALDRAFEVGSYHCVCVLESDVDEGAAWKPALAAETARDPHNPTATFDAIGHACVELLLPMAKMVRALDPGQVLKVVTDDVAAREDLSSWCRMTGNEMLDRIKGSGCENYYIRRGSAM
jgi:radical SAM protein with 4Fe4S-binding SPASM domain